MAEVTELLNDEKYNISFEVKTYDNTLANSCYRDNYAFDFKNTNSNLIEHAQNIGLAVTKAVTEWHNLVKNSKSDIADDQIALQENCYSIASDYHGDNISFLGQLALAGAVIIDPNKVVYYNLDKDEIYDNKEKIAEIKLKHDNGELIHDNYDPTIDENISEKDRIVAIPYMELNPNFKGEIICLGDYIDKGPESQHNLATINYLSHLQKSNPIPGKVTFLLGNHDVLGFEGNTSSLISYSNIIQRMVKDDIFQTCVTREITKIDTDGHEFKEPLVFSHAALIKKDLPAMFLFASRLLGKDENFNKELNEDPEAKAAFEEVQTFFMNELNKEKNADLKALLNSLDENYWQEINNYSISDYWHSIGIELYDKLISKGFTEKQIFQLKNLIGNASYGLFGRINPQGNDMIDTYGAQGLGWIYGNRLDPDENEELKTTQYIGHTSKINVLETSNIIYEDVKRTLGHHKNSSLIFNDYIDQQGNRYQQTYSVERNNNGEIFPDQINQNELKLGVDTSKGLIQNKKGYKKRFQSKKRMLNIFTENKFKPIKAPKTNPPLLNPNSQSEIKPKLEADPKLLQLNELLNDENCKTILPNEMINDLKKKTKNIMSNEELNNEIQNIFDSINNSLNGLYTIPRFISLDIQGLANFIKENQNYSLEKKVILIYKNIFQIGIPEILTQKLNESNLDKTSKEFYLETIKVLSEKIMPINQTLALVFQINERIDKKIPMKAINKTKTKKQSIFSFKNKNEQKSKKEQEEK